MNFRENEEAVSPVIGVILMVAITVILAAVIAAFVFGMTGNVQTTKTVSVGSSLASSGIVITIQGGADLNTLVGLSFTLDGDVLGPADMTYTSDQQEWNTDDNMIILNSTDTTVNSTDTTAKFRVGDSYTVTGAQSGAGRLVVVGLFADGSEQILLDRTF